MHKFKVSYEDSIEVGDNDPCLYLLRLGEYFYIHKSKFYKQGVETLLTVLFRGIRGGKSQEYLKNVVALCNKYPSLYKVVCTPLYTGSSTNILRKESALLKKYKNDPKCVNNFEIAQLKPEWMLKEKYQERCKSCIKNAIIEGKKKKFNFCPICGRQNKLK